MGVIASCFLACSIGLPPILNVGSQAMKDRVARDIITGQKMIALAITEPWAGSDVAAIQTTAVLSSDGTHYIVNGQKKFITNGGYADFFTTAVRTGKEGMGGISLLLIERDMPGFTIRRLKTQGWASSSTTHLLFENVKVPVKNLIGKENHGFRAIMINFNHERWVGIVKTIRGCRSCIEEAIKYARLRKTFGKRLVEHQVIRHKIAEMARLTETAFALLETLTFQMQNGIDVSALLALLKVHATKTLEFCAREASQVIGGNSFLKTGPGAIVERIYRDVRVAAIGGGSEEIMLDLAMRQSKL